MESTLEQRQAVRRDECRAHGHSFDTIGTSSGPVRIVCSNCGASWRLHPDDAGMPWGTES